MAAKLQPRKLIGIGKIGLFQRRKLVAGGRRWLWMTANMRNGLTK